MSPGMRKGVLPTRPKSNAPVHTAIEESSR
jgi:hypothetical protein